MQPMTPQTAVNHLLAHGWSEARIAREIGTSQPTVHRIKHGHQGAAYRTVSKLIELAATVGQASEGQQGASHAA